MKDEEDFLRHAVSELDRLSPEMGEDAELDQKRRLMQAAEKIGADVSIQNGPKNKGKLVIKYNSLDELDGILAHIQ